MAKAKVKKIKAKSNSGAKKRFRFTGSGKIRRYKASKSHILTKKTRKRKRNLRKAGIVDKTNEGAVKRLLPYGA